jgi:hypothetical protein
MDHSTATVCVVTAGVVNFYCIDAGKTAASERLQESNAKAQNSVVETKAANGTSQDFLRSAARAVASAGSNHSGDDSNDAADQEIRELARFGKESGLILDESIVLQWFSDVKNTIKPGIEHKVVVRPLEGLVIKDYDTRLFDEETGAVFYKPAELVFDYLSDHLLANFLFGDDIRLIGLAEIERSLHVLITQPYVSGKHPKWNDLIERLERQGLEQESSGSSKAHFWVDGGEVGPILVTDVHEDNVIVDRNGFAHLIDIHFKFDSRADRMETLKSLGLL